jgi:xanthine dehydrogenase accessory protein XdhC
VRLLFERFGETESKYISALIDTGAAYFARPVTSGKPIVGIDGANEHASPPPFLLEALSTSSQPLCFLLPHPDGKEMWFVERVRPKQLVIYLYGAGHVAREVVRVFAGMDAEIVWIDVDEDRFPKIIPAHVKRLIATAPQTAAAYAPENAFHVVMTCSHPLDLEICHAILQRGVFRYLGLIGSQTKRERFIRRLRELGIPEESLARLTCPIGADGPKGKEPGVIAIALAGEILKLNDLSDTS